MIRDFVAADLDALVSVHLAAEQADATESARQQKRKSWERFLTVPDRHLQVWEQDGELGAFIAYGPARAAVSGTPENSAEIYTLFVAPACWRRGIGRKLARYAITELSRQRWDAIGLWVYGNNLPALRLYAGLGFCETAARKTSPADGRTALYYQLSLSQAQQPSQEP